MHIRQSAGVPGSPLFAEDLPGLYFDPDPRPAPDPAPAPAPDPNAPAPAPDQNNQENAWRRKFEDTDKELKRLQKVEQDRKDAELAEIDREKKQRTDAESRAAAAEAKALKLEIANELGLSKDAMDLLTATDEAALRAQAERIVKLTGTNAGNGQGGQKPPVQAGGVTQPGGQQQPTVHEKIGAALKAGNDLAAIRLMREKQFGK